MKIQSKTVPPVHDPPITPVLALVTACDSPFTCSPPRLTSAKDTAKQVSGNLQVHFNLLWKEHRNQQTYLILSFSLSEYALLNNSVNSQVKASRDICTLVGLPSFSGLSPTANACVKNPTFCCSLSKLG